jgi:ribosomal protein S18 acetylase RimI-like enzyme
LAEAESRGDEFWRAQVCGTLGERACATWVAVDAAGEGAGMLTGVEQPDRVDVIQVWVDPGRRGSGLVDELFAHLFAWAPHERIDIAIAEDNDRARAVYERLGFEVTAERPGVHGIEIEMTQRRRR